MTQFICKNVSLGYDGAAVASNLNFKIDSGDYLCIVGENGAGKSTLVKAMLSLTAPLCGEFQFCDGFDKSEIGYLPQQNEMQKDFPASVEEVVISGCLNKCKFKPFYGKKEKTLALKNMKKLGIENLKKRCYRELSGGQQQRVLLARALCAAGRFLVLDEPVSCLDPVATSEMYAIIRKLNSEDGMTVVMVSHDVNAAVKYAKSILHMEKNPIFFESVEDYLKSDTGKKFVSGKEV